jgi:hypothetical protein
VHRPWKLLKTLTLLGLINRQGSTSTSGLSLVLFDIPCKVSRIRAIQGAIAAVGAILSVFFVECDVNYVPREVSRDLGKWHGWDKLANEEKYR